MTAGKRLRFIALLLALCLAAALPASAAGTASDSLITESWLDDWADELLAEAVSGIDGALEGAGQGGLTATEYVLSDGDRVSLGEGASVLLVSGAASMSVSGTVVNATAGAVASSGDVSARELYIVAGDSSASVVADGGARIAVWGSANVTERTLVFTDVAEGSWYYDYVYSAVAVGLIDGVTETTFEPESGFTVAQAIKIAACLHQYYHNGTVTLQNGEPWYKTYVDYAVANGVAGESYAAMSDAQLNEPIDRRDFAVIFYNAMPAYEYAPINTVESIPDVRGRRRDLRALPRGHPRRHNRGRLLPARERHPPQRGCGHRGEDAGRRPARQDFKRIRPEAPAYAGAFYAGWERSSRLCPEPPEQAPGGAFER